jgi:hypothetical protein
MMKLLRSWRQTNNPNIIDGKDDEHVLPDFEGGPIAGFPAAYLGIITGGADTPLSYSSFGSSSGSSTSDTVRDVKCDVLANWLHAKAEARMWMSGQPGEGIFVKKTKGNYALCPADLDFDTSGIFEAITEMNVRVRIL